MVTEPAMVSSDIHLLVFTPCVVSSLTVPALVCLTNSIWQTGCCVASQIRLQKTCSFCYELFSLFLTIQSGRTTFHVLRRLRQPMGRPCG